MDSWNHEQHIPKTFVCCFFCIKKKLYFQLTAHSVYDVLCAADMFLLPGLKRQCANVVGQFLEVENVVNILRSARLYELPRLEDQCAEFIAANIYKVTVLVIIHV